MSIQHVVFAATHARLQNFDASHQAQFPSELMRIEGPLCFAPAFGEVPHARETDRRIVPIGTLKDLRGEIIERAAEGSGSTYSGFSKSYARAFDG